MPQERHIDECAREEIAARGRPGEGVMEGERRRRGRRRRTGAGERPAGIWSIDFPRDDGLWPRSHCRTERERERIADGTLRCIHPPLPSPRPPPTRYRVFNVPLQFVWAASESSLTPLVRTKQLQPLQVNSGAVCHRVRRRFAPATDGAV